MAGHCVTTPTGARIWVEDTAAIANVLKKTASMNRHAFLLYGYFRN